MMKMKTSKLGFPGIFWKSHALSTTNDYENYANRIRKTLYYGRLPSTHRPSLPVTGLLVDKFGEFCKQDGFDHLNLHEASSICYDACVTPCSVIVALLYLDRLRTQNPDYLASTSPSKVFIVALMVASKYLYDDGEEDEVFNDEWATSAAVLLSDLNEAEKNFLSAIEWNLFVDVKSFMKGLLYVESTIAKDQGMQRGYFVYSDLVTLSKTLPPLLNYFINLVGSALVICVVSYTAVVCIVVAGTVASRQFTIQIAHQPHVNLHPSLSVTSCQTNYSSCCASAVENCEAILGNSIWTKEKIVSNLTGKKLEKKNSESAVGSTSFSSRFGALRTLTTALLFASSSKFVDVPPSHLSHFCAMDNALGLFHAWYRVPSNAVAIEKNISSDGEMSFEYSEDESQNLRRLPRSRKLSRRWRKPHISTGSSLNESQNHTSSSVNFCACNTTELHACCPERSVNESLSKMELNEEWTNLHAYLEYSYMIIHSIEAFIHPKLSVNPVAESRTILRPDPELLNLSALGRSKEHFSLFWTTKENYSPFVLHDNPLHRNGPPNLILPWIWNSLLSFAHLPKNPDPIEIDWKTGNLAMVT